MKTAAFATLVATAAAVPQAWSDWAAETSSSTPAATTTSSYDPSETWADWSSTSSTPAATTTSSYDPSWSDWESATSSTPAATTTSSYDPSWSDWETATYTTTVVTELETYCATPTVFVHAGETYSCSSSTVTITGSLTVSVPVVTKTSSSCQNYSPTAGLWNPVAPGKGSSTPAAYTAPAGTGAWSSPVSPYATSSAPVAAYTGAANRVANVGVGLAGVAAAAAFLL